MTDPDTTFWAWSTPLIPVNLRIPNTLVFTDASNVDLHRDTLGSIECPLFNAVGDIVGQVAHLELFAEHYYAFGFVWNRDTATAMHTGTVSPTYSLYDVEIKDITITSAKISSVHTNPMTPEQQTRPGRRFTVEDPL